MATKGWRNVTKDNPCRICEKPDFCTVSEDGTVACCMRVAGGKPAKNGGYVYKLEDPVPKHKLMPKKAKPDVPVDQMADLSRSYQLRATGQLVAMLASSLGVSVASLLELEIGYDGQVYTFPMRNECDQVIGIKVRSKGGRKWCIPGSQLGLYWPISVSRHSDSLLVICEGESDTAALLDMGFDAIGRPGNVHATEAIESFLRAKRRPVLIMSDHDEIKNYRGTKCRPGWVGAAELAKRISRLTLTTKIIKPPRHKDIRAWYQDGATKAQVLALAANARVQPK